MFKFVCGYKVTPPHISDEELGEKNYDRMFG
jgi:hypothetical protein